MSDREKLIEMLDRLFVDYGAQAVYFTDQECEDIADYLISNGVTVQKWIPVSERLPSKEDGDAFGRVYAISEGAYPRMRQWSMVVKYPECFTHWHKLPEPPKECE